jgi:hypothetical protein
MLGSVSKKITFLPARTLSLNIQQDIDDDDDDDDKKS